MILCPVCSAALFRTGGAAWWCATCIRHWGPVELRIAGGPDGPQARCAVCWQPVAADLSASNTQALYCAQHQGGPGSVVQHSGSGRP